MRGVLRIAGLVVVWVALWSDVSSANILSGIVVGAVTCALFSVPPSAPAVVRPLRVVLFVLYFIVRLVQSSIVVARTVVVPHRRIHSGIVAVPLRGCSDAVATIIADAISLTPGTLTLEVRRNPLTLFVHALDVRDVEQVQADVRALEVLAVKAFGSQDAVAGLAVDDTVSWRTR